MTRNQIEYLKHRETKRNNQEVERLTSLRDKRANAVALASLDETSKHNRATEAEASRHNIALEGQSYLSLGEAQRHNLASESLAATTAIEQQRSNVTREQEAHRANLASEKELSRHNLAQEALSKAQLSELANYHTESISLGHRNADASFASIAESARHNAAAEEESIRHNTASEQLTSRNLDLTSQFNTNKFSLDSQRQQLSEQQFQQQKHNDTIRNTTSIVNTAGDTLQTITNVASKIALAMP